MTDLDAALLDAWFKLKPVLEADPEALQRRLARRRSATLLRPPREWCMAVRAGDHRITPENAAIDPPRATRLPNDYSTRRRQQHTLTLTKPLLQTLCATVRLCGPHEDECDVARRLGVHRAALFPARKKGIFTTEHYKNLFGRHGKPVPMIFSRQLFDPCAGQFWRRPHALWGTHWQFLADFLPDNFAQTLTRVPFYVGTSDAVRAGSSDKESFRGWRWVCPACKKQIRKLFCPIRPMNFIELLNLDPAPPPASDVDTRPVPAAAFACQQCHRVQYFSPVQRGSWNQFVTHLSAGMLYGSEVEKPAWFKPERRQAYRPLPGAKPSKRQQEVLEGLLRGWTMKQIGVELGIKTDTVGKYAQIVYRHHHVRTRVELMEVLGVQNSQSVFRGKTRGAGKHAVQPPRLNAARAGTHLSTCSCGACTARFDRDTTTVTSARGA